MSCFTDIENKPDDWLVLDPLTVQKPTPKTGCDTNLIVLNYLSEFKTDALKLKVKDNLGLYVDNILSKNSTNPIANKTVYEAFSKFTGSNNITKITWDANSNMNDFKTAGVYDIYGERTRQDDNLPILNASPGHSIAARLNVVDSSLRKTDGTLPTEICVTQFLMLSNRKGGDGNMYVRTYNENNSPAADWWTPWQKLQGIREGYIFTDTVQVNPDGGVQEIEGVTGLNNMIDNGIYSGIYTNDPTFASPTFIDTFTLIVINNYAVAGQDQRLNRTISQLKYAVDALTNQASVKQRTKTDGSDWTDWTDIGGGGSKEVDITDAVKTYGLPTLFAQGLAKEGIVYSCYLTHKDITNNLNIFDKDKKISNFILGKTSSDICVKIEFNQRINSWGVAYIDIYGYGCYYKVIMSGSLFDNIRVSSDMTVL